MLIRHAPAVERGAPEADRARELTPRGKKKMVKAAATLKWHLKGRQEFVLLTSPAVRAVQTADILAKALQIEAEHRYLPEIYTGEPEALFAALAGLPQDATALVVGHEPHLSGWSELLTGMPIAFRKAGMAGLTRVDGAPLRAEVQWLYRAQTPKGMPAKRKAEPFTVKALQNIMIHRVLAILDMRKAFIKQPGRVRTVHQLRVSLRQTRSLLSFLRPALKGPALDNVQAALRAMAGTLAYLRELDVLLIEWRAFLKEHLELQGGKALTGALLKERHREQVAALPRIADPMVEEMLHGVLAWIDGWGREYGRGTKLNAAARKRLDAWMQDIARGMARLDVDDLPRTHALRLKIKKARYAQESIPFLRERQPLDAAQLKALQDDLGTICDTHAHIDLLERLMASAPQPQSSQEMALFAAYLADLRDALRARLKA
ncbi:MAG: CHAD domain-containing protein [Clostridiales bacterium]|nr:CHAD domain-containing protein [Clostridiales bacterium]